MLQVTFAEVARLLMSLGSMVPAAEGHGYLCGALCTNDHYTFERWREELIPDESGVADELGELEDSATARVSAADEQALQLLFGDTVAALSDQNSDFEPLLPDDDVALEQRASALSQWASGFLYGFGTARAAANSQISPAVAEILQDFARLGAAAAETDIDGEEQEHAYAELVEYLRVGVWLVHAELAAARDGDADMADQDRADLHGPDQDEADDPLH